MFLSVKFPVSPFMYFLSLGTFWDILFLISPREAGTSILDLLLLLLYNWRRVGLEGDFLPFG